MPEGELLNVSFEYMSTYEKEVKIKDSRVVFPKWKWACGVGMSSVLGIAVGNIAYNLQYSYLGVERMWAVLYFFIAYTLIREWIDSLFFEDLRVWEFHKILMKAKNTGWSDEDIKEGLEKCDFGGKVTKTYLKKLRMELP